MSGRREHPIADVLPVCVGRSGGAAEAKAASQTEKTLEAPKKATNLIDRGWSHIEAERTEIALTD